MTIYHSDQSATEGFKLKHLRQKRPIPAKPMKGYPKLDCLEGG